MPKRINRWQIYTLQLSTLSRIILSISTNRLYQIRNDFAARYISGEGYEIGAQKCPLFCKNAKMIRYIDYLSREESSQKYNIPESECVNVDLIADANDLTEIPSNSASFIIANHVLEHSPNPIGTLVNWLRLLHSNGKIFLTLPNYRSNEFDFEKTPATLAHLIKDHEGAKNNKDISTSHIYEHIQMIDEIEQSDANRFTKRYNQIVESKLHTHYHVFNKHNVTELLRFINKQIPIKINNYLTFENGFELLFIIEKIETTPSVKMVINKDHFFNFIISVKHTFLYLANKITRYLLHK